MPQGEPLPQNKSRRKRTATLEAVFSIVALVFTGIAIYQTVNTKHTLDAINGDDVKANIQVLETQRLAAEMHLREVKAQATLIENENAILQQKLRDALKHGGKNPQRAEWSSEDRVAFTSLNNNVAQLDVRMKALEDALKTTPEKALSLPLLKQQVEAAHERSRSDMESFQKLVVQLLTQSYWFVGTFAAIFMGLLALGFISVKRTD